MAENQKVDLSTLPKGLTRYIRSIEYRTPIAKHTSEWRKH